jgi:hypothetical protein
MRVALGPSRCSDAVLRARQRWAWAPKVGHLGRMHVAGAAGARLRWHGQVG